MQTKFGNLAKQITNHIAVSDPEPTDCETVAALIAALNAWNVLHCPMAIQPSEKTLE